MSKIHLEIVTPDRLFYEGEIESIIVRGMEGDLAILKGRTPIVTPLKIGKLRIFKDDKESIASVSHGYLSVIEDVVTIVTDSAEWPEEIDIDRAEEAKQRAKKLLQESNVDFARADAALKRSINRLEISKRR